ncbi:hypothetical protein ACHAXR_009917 [Thalassiosira sp. AJA248-18]
MPKRDRWSSDEEEGDDGKASSTSRQNEQAGELATKKLDHYDDTSRPSTQSIAIMKASPPPGFRFHNPLLHGCRSVYDSYERLSHLDEGTYGVVWKARDNSTDDTVAIKQIKFDDDMTKEGTYRFPISALREIGVLLSLSHECIVTVREMVVGNTNDKVFMVMEIMEMDLQAAMKKAPGATTPFAQSEVKFMMHQILSAMAHVHERWFIHRDIKTSNILVHKTGRIALCDFGLARKYELPARKMTQMVVTLWYRSPELLFGESIYGPEIDMWSIGCIFGELLIKDAIIKGTGELDQIQKTFKLLGTPTDADWPEFSSLPSAGTFKWKNIDGSVLGRQFLVNSFSATGQSYLDPSGFDLLSKLLSLNPRKRISAEEALKHSYFTGGVKKQVPQFFT